MGAIFLGCRNPLFNEIQKARIFDSGFFGDLDLYKIVFSKLWLVYLKI